MNLGTRRATAILAELLPIEQRALNSPDNPRAAPSCRQTDRGAIDRDGSLGQPNLHRSGCALLCHIRYAADADGNFPKAA